VVKKSPKLVNVICERPLSKIKLFHGQKGKSRLSIKSQSNAHLYVILKGIQSEPTIEISTLLNKEAF
jgi:hypothetical protein